MTRFRVDASIKDFWKLLLGGGAETPEVDAWELSALMVRPKPSFCWEVAVMEPMKPYRHI